MEEILIVGHSPGKVEAGKSPTRKRVAGWLKETGVESWDWTNLVHYNAPSLKMSDVTLKQSYVKRYSKVIALGRIAEDWLESQGIEHLAVPHPSGLNRIWNDPDVEPMVVEKIKKYVKS